MSLLGTSPYLLSIHPSIAAHNLEGVRDAGEGQSGQVLLLPVVKLLHREIVKLTAQPDYLQRFAALGREPVANTPQKFAAILRVELPKWARVIAEAGMQKVDRGRCAGRRIECIE